MRLATPPRITSCLIGALVGICLAGAGTASAAKGGPVTLVTSQMEGPPSPRGQPVRGLAHLRVRPSGATRVSGVFSGVAIDPTVPDTRFFVGVSQRRCAQFRSNPSQQIVVGPPGKQIEPDRYGYGSAYLNDTEVFKVPQSTLSKARSMVLARRTPQATQFAACGGLARWVPAKQLQGAFVAAKGGRKGLLTAEVPGLPGQTAQGIADIAGRLKVRPGPDRLVARQITALLIGMMPAERVALATSSASCAGAPLFQNGWIEGVSTTADTYGNALISATTIQADLRSARSAAIFRNSQGSWLACGPFSLFGRLTKDLE
jgi:hypothetical protein